jgi:predicted O-methyltransferase YrrM
MTAPQDHPDWHALLGMAPDAYADSLSRQKPDWAEGSLSFEDTRFLLSELLDAPSSPVVEIGTATGFSTAVLALGLEVAARAGVVPDDFAVVSYDLSETLYYDSSKRVGEVARLLLPPALLAHVDFVAPGTAVTARGRHGPDSVGFVFVDGAHRHPWPTLDLIALLDCLRPGARVVLHDIELPVRDARFRGWGVKHLFDDLSLPKRRSVDSIPNVGSIRVPEDKDAFRDDLLRTLYEHRWQEDVPVSHTTAALA